MERIVIVLLALVMLDLLSIEKKLKQILAILQDSQLSAAKGELSLLSGKRDEDTMRP